MRVFIRWLTMALVAGLLVPVVWLLSGMWSKENAHFRYIESPVTKSSSDKPNGSTQQRKLVDIDVDRPQQWRNHVQHSCEKLGFHTDFDANILKHDKKILVDDHNKLLYCQIPKVASTTWRRIFIMLSGKVNVKDPMTISSNDVHHTYDKYLTYLSDFPPDQILHRVQNYFKFVFVREPFERLLSAFRNKFVTSTNSSMYFKKAFGRRIIKQYRHNLPKLSDSDNLQFEEFVKYLTDSDKKIGMNEHWEQFHKLCHPCLISYDFIGKLETIEEDSKYVLEKNHLAGKVKLPSRSDSRYGRQKTNSFMTQYYSKIPRTAIKALYRMYEADFKIFNYTIPDSVKVLM